jgi:hypothetical protein
MIWLTSGQISGVGAGWVARLLCRRGVRVRAAPARNRPAVLPSVLPVLGVSQQPTPGALCAEDQVGTVGDGDLVGAGCFGVLQAVPTRSSLLTSSLPWSTLSSERCCTSGNCAFATILPVLDLCFAGWCWMGGWAFTASLEGDKIVDQHISIITRAVSVFLSSECC